MLAQACVGHFYRVEIAMIQIAHMLTASDNCEQPQVSSKLKCVVLLQVAVASMALLVGLRTVRKNCLSLVVSSRCKMAHPASNHRLSGLMLDQTRAHELTQMPQHRHLKGAVSLGQKNYPRRTDKHAQMVEATVDLPGIAQQ